MAFGRVTIRYADTTPKTAVLANSGDASYPLDFCRNSEVVRRRDTKRRLGAYPMAPYS
jgi:hypothetical protein